MTVTRRGVLRIGREALSARRELFVAGGSRLHTGGRRCRRPDERSCRATNRAWPVARQLVRAVALRGAAAERRIRVAKDMASVGRERNPVRNRRVHAARFDIPRARSLRHAAARHCIAGRWRRTGRSLASRVGDERARRGGQRRRRGGRLLPSAAERNLAVRCWSSSATRWMPACTEQGCRHRKQGCVRRWHGPRGKEHHRRDRRPCENFRRPLDDFGLARADWRGPGCHCAVRAGVAGVIPTRYERHAGGGKDSS